eukprot:1156693-Pelagomonas_calceolata.AAC.3
MVQILECRPDSCLAWAMLWVIGPYLACCVHGYWTDALNWRDTRGYVMLNHRHCTFTVLEAGNTREKGLSQDENTNVLGIRMVNGTQTGHPVGDMKMQKREVVLKNVIGPISPFNLKSVNPQPEFGSVAKDVMGKIQVHPFTVVYSGIRGCELIPVAKKQTNEAYRCISDLMDIFCAVGTVKQTEQPNYLAEGHNNGKRDPSTCPGEKTGSGEEVVGRNTIPGAFLV